MEKPGHLKEPIGSGPLQKTLRGKDGKKEDGKKAGDPFAQQEALIDN